MLILALAGRLFAAGQSYELRGRLVPESPAAVSLFGATTPFQTETSRTSAAFPLSGALAPASTPLPSFCRAKARYGKPSSSDPEPPMPRAGSPSPFPSTILIWFLEKRSRISARFPRGNYPFRERRAVSMKKPGKDSPITMPMRPSPIWRRPFIAPQFTTAWNTWAPSLTRRSQYARADECFRKALQQNPASYEPLVNLGGHCSRKPKPARPCHTTGMPSAAAPMMHCPMRN